MKDKKYLVKENFNLKMLLKEVKETLYHIRDYHEVKRCPSLVMLLTEIEELQLLEEKDEKV